MILILEANWRQFTVHTSLVISYDTFKKKCDIDILTISWKWHDNCITIYHQTICRGLLLMLRWSRCTCPRHHQEATGPDKQVLSSAHFPISIPDPSRTPSQSSQSPSWNAGHLPPDTGAARLKARRSLLMTTIRILLNCLQYTPSSSTGMAELSPPLLACNKNQIRHFQSNWSVNLSLVLPGLTQFWGSRIEDKQTKYKASATEMEIQQYRY